jgi:lysyl-tRNA synthetase class 2
VSDQDPGGGTAPVPGWPSESAARLAKAVGLRARGINPYPARFVRSHSLGEIVAAYGSKSAEELERLSASVQVAGRVLTLRGHGRATFATLADGEGELQIYVRADGVGEGGYRMLAELDRGDFIGVKGRLMRTRKGELSVEASELSFLAKALLPPPEKWHGLADVEARYRQRYLDLMANPEVRRTFLARSGIVAAMRRFLDARGYVEVETPMMHPVPGGAIARPFVTRHNALGVDLYLRIAPELYLKRLVVGGLERVYEINRSFRNEGLSSLHNPEFTMLEFYTAWFDYGDVMDLTEALVVAAAEAAGEQTRTYRGRALGFATPFPRLTMKAAVARGLAEQGIVGLDAGPAGLSDAVASPAFAALCARRGLEVAAYRGLPPGRRLARIFDDFVADALWRPTFVTDYPVEVSPLAKARADDAGTAERFELYIAGMEIANGYSELNDPLEQRRQFLAQAGRREGGDLEAHAMDEDYIRALGHGLPPTGGCGLGIDRLTMVLTDSPSIRDVILFPQMRPEGGRAGGEGEGSGSGPR